LSPNISFLKRLVHNVATASWVQDFTHLGLVIIPAQLILLVETLDKSSLTQLLKISKDDENNNKPIIFGE